MFSLITGTYRQAKQYGGGFFIAVVVLGRSDGSNLESERDVHTLVEGTTAMVLRNQDGQVAKIDSAAGGSKLMINHVAL